MLKFPRTDSSHAVKRSWEQNKRICRQYNSFAIQRAPWKAPGAWTCSSALHSAPRYSGRDRRRSYVTIVVSGLKLPKLLLNKVNEVISNWTTSSWSTFVTRPITWAPIFTKSLEQLNGRSTRWSHQYQTLCHYKIHDVTLTCKADQILPQLFFQKYTGTGVKSCVAGCNGEHTNLIRLTRSHFWIRLNTGVATACPVVFNNFCTPYQLNHHFIYRHQNHRKIN